MKLTLTLLLAVLALAACKDAEVETAAPVAAETEAESLSEVLASVNGESITQDDVDFMISRTFSGSEQLFFNEEMQAKVLDSLIAVSYTHLTLPTKA